jgi:hypothetical protein
MSGIIIRSQVVIRNAIKQALTDPIVAPQLPSGIAKDIAASIALETDVWTDHDDKVTQHAFKWAMSNLK